MPIPRKNPRTVLSEEQRKLTEDSTVAITTLTETQSAISTSDINNAEEQRIKRNNSADSKNDTKTQKIQGDISTKGQRDKDTTLIAGSTSLQIDKTEKPNTQSDSSTSSTMLKKAQDAQRSKDKMRTELQNAISADNTKDQRNNGTTATTRSVSSQTDEMEKPNRPSSMNTSLIEPQNIQSAKDKKSTESQSDMSTNDTVLQSAEDREREVYYLTLNQVDKLDDLRIAYRKATGKRLSKQDFMRHIVDSLDLNMLI
jgi:hypothetical protein